MRNAQPAYAAEERYIRVLVTVRGIVQGVSFRKQTLRKALELDVRGWVRNAEDGSVEALFEGPESGVSALLAWCSRGPERSQVQSVSSCVQEYTGEEFEDFRILYPE